MEELLFAERWPIRNGGGQCNLILPGKHHNFHMTRTSYRNGRNTVAIHNSLLSVVLRERLSDEPKKLFSRACVPGIVRGRAIVKKD